MIFYKAMDNFSKIQNIPANNLSFNRRMAIVGRDRQNQLSILNRKSVKGKGLKIDIIDKNSW